MDAADRRRVAELTAAVPPMPDDVADRVAAVLDMEDQVVAEAA